MILFFVANLDHLSGDNVRKDVSNTAGFRSNQDNSEGSSRHLLLELNAFIKRDEYFISILRE